jgi:hypothetical protein
MVTKKKGRVITPGPYVKLASLPMVQFESSQLAYDPHQLLVSLLVCYLPSKGPDEYLRY